MKVAFLGLGIMGNAMARNLVKAGHDVTVWNRTPKSIDGAQSAKSPADAARAAEVVWTCVSDTAAVERMLFAPDGVTTVAKTGMIIADSSTISPSATKDFASRLRAKGADYVDAPVTGSKVGAESAQLIFIVGGSSSSLSGEKKRRLPSSSLYFQQWEKRSSTWERPDWANRRSWR